jgi:nucleotide-binding universal stress UspA family protein
LPPSSRLSRIGKILVPCDGSKPSVNALNRAMEVSARTENKVEIIMLYVVSDIDLPLLYDADGLATPGSPESRQHLRGMYLYIEKEAVEMLDGIRKRIKMTPADQENKISIRLEVLYGNPAEKIVEFAEQEDVDLIVMGNVGVRGIISRFKALGSVSRKVSEKTTRPIMIVPYRKEGEGDE